MNTHRNRTRARLMRGWWDEMFRSLHDQDLFLGRFKNLVKHMQDVAAPNRGKPSPKRRKFYWRNPVGCTQPNVKACLRGCVGTCEAMGEAEGIKKRVNG